MRRTRIPSEVVPAPPELDAGFIFWARTGLEDWEDVRVELAEAFEGSKAAAVAEESIVYVVSNDALLGRSGAPAAMVAAGLLSGARTAAIEGSRKGWTANVLAYDSVVDEADVLEHAVRLLENGLVTGELIHLGPGHIGKALA